MNKSDQFDQSDLAQAMRLRRRQHAAATRRRRVRIAITVGAGLGLLILVGTRLTRSHSDAGANADGGMRGAAGLSAAGRRAIEAERERTAIERTLSYTPFIRRGTPNRREVALTFDDGPGPYTPEILKILKRHHVEATFFEIGRMIPYFDQSTERQVRDGHVIGNHTFDHVRMGSLSPVEQAGQLISATAMLQANGAPAPSLFRPPSGSFDRATFAALKHRKMLMVLWSADTEDYTDPGASVITEKALQGVRPGSIILLHDGGGNRSQTVEALPDILRGLRHRRLTPVTIPRLVLDDPPPRGQRIPWGLAGGTDAAILRPSPSAANSGL